MRVVWVRKAETDEELRNKGMNREDTAWIHEHDIKGTFLGLLAVERGEAG